ncbi:hypothetical protein MYX77_13775, partial [Acidobacteriia bacterium AH_259_A11_L15]|nr:hypothetical protein [Acidobacteriia bacterium AH_259_A11_L15]
VFYGVLEFLGKGILVIGAFYFGRHFSNLYEPRWKNYLAVVGIVGIVSLAIWASYGTHMEDSDPIFGGGEEVVDFEPTDKQRNEYGARIFFSLIIPALFGVYRG